MEPELLLAFPLALLVGVSLGMLGGGGSILTVPILTYVLGMPPREAIAASLFIVGTTSAVGAVSHARAGRVRWKIGLIFGIAGMGGAFLGGFAGGFLPEALLMVLFAVMMVATATAMLRGRRSPGEAKPLSTIRIILDGAMVGAATGLVGAGGGFLVVPALNMLGGLPMAVAVGTSLLVIALKSFAGMAGYLLTVSVSWAPVIGFTATAIAGSFIGNAVAGRIPETALRRAFGVFVLVMGVFVLAQELPHLLA